MKKLGWRRAWSRSLLRAGPALLLLGMAVLVADWRLFFLGGALGWLLAAEFIWRGRAGMNVQAAVRHLRQGELDRALAVMDELIRAEPDEADHLRFRADLYRLAGDSGLAERDYEQLVRLAPESADGCIGLAEIWVQRGDYQRARECAQQAATRDPRGWQPSYTLALIADRQGDAPGAVTSARAALNAGIPDRSFRLLVCLWLARGHSRLGQSDEALSAVGQLRRDERALAEWNAILGSAQGAPIRELLGADVQLARALSQGTVVPEMLAGSGGAGR